MSSLRRSMRHIRKFPHLFAKQVVQRLFRLLARLPRQRRRSAQSGFVFPTTVLLVIVTILTATALTVRAYRRGSDVIVERQQQVITNAASPAIDRARAKLEYLFARDDRAPRKVPNSNQLVSMLRATETTDDIQPRDSDIYTLSDETRIDIDGNPSTIDNAWVFSADINGDGVVGSSEVVAYSILLDDINETDDVKISDPVTSAKAAAQVPRNGPINTTQIRNDCGGGQTGASEEGWQIAGPNTLAKNFQITAYAADLGNLTRPAATLELQQVREAARGNKWGAWFRYDLEVFPGANFNWNGAMHTQGSMFVANKFNGYMISSKASCLYGADLSSSEITLGAENPDEGFKGHLFNGNAERAGNAQGSPKIHRDNGTNNPQQVTVNATTQTATATLPSDIFLDPIQVYLNDISRHAGTVTEERTPEAKFGGRVRNIRETELRRISLDDTFRADNRYGPKQVYEAGKDPNGRIPAGTDIGTNIPASNDKLRNSESGLDGYWERRAIREGMRLIVGQRLELGNVNGWGFDPTNPAASAPDKEPLYPPDNLQAVATGQGKFGLAEQAQRKALRDNLAAVQGMVVYHYETGSGETPIACIASTAHFGTLKAVADSRTFRDTGLTAPAATFMADFLTGKGTNGWEFAPANTTGGSVSGTLSTALTNLARFAGDPKGGAPSFTPVQAAKQIHPHPYMAMWGDFSALRRVHVAGDGNGSPADKTTIDTAACTMRLLAYNLKAIYDEYEAITIGRWRDLADALIKVVADDYTNANRLDKLSNNTLREWFEDLEKVKNKTLPDGRTIDNVLLARIRKDLVTAHRYWEVERDRTLGFKTGVGLPISNLPRGSVNFPKYTQGAATSTGGIPRIPGVGDSAIQNVTCDPLYFNTLGNGRGSNYTQQRRALVLAVSVCPRANQPHRFPSLFYLFPTYTHNRAGTGPIAATPRASFRFKNGTGAGTDREVTTPPTGYLAQGTEEYVTQVTEGATANFTRIPYADIIAATMAAQPRATSANFKLPTFTAARSTAFNTTDWKSLDAPDQRPWDIVRTNTDGTVTTFGVSLLDKVMFSGREAMPIRLLDVNVDQLTQGTNVADHWIAGRDANNFEHFGLVYAFREDAVREDEIVRQSSGGAAACITYDTYKAYATASNNCYMRIQANHGVSSSDPPLGPFKISIKPVDYIPDPDRRGYGFRLREGANLNRAANEQSGISFISDNAVAIQGDFNLHTDGTAAQEEFKDAAAQIFQLDPEDANFYTKFYGRTSLNVGTATDRKFSKPSTDRWRPSEILGDAIYILSTNAKDGFAEAAYAADAGGGNFQFENTNSAPFGKYGRVSFQNMNRPGATSNKLLPNADTYWREDGKGTEVSSYSVEDNASGPIYFDRNGDVYQGATPVAIGRGSSTLRYWGMGILGGPNAVGSLERFRYQNLPRASAAAATAPSAAGGNKVTVNALLISGILPARPGQSSGGLHNFPRMNEDWSGMDLNIAGGFFQLFFSHSSTGPWDADAWEYNETPGAGITTRNIGHYFPPNRVWGYDVALQYSPQSPISSRFVSVNDPRSEFYRELPVEDPYVKQLRCASVGGNRVDPNASCT